MTAAQTLDEFGLIARYFAPLAADYPGALGLLDDAALIDVPPGQRLVVTTDTLVADVHFLAADPPGSIARKAVRVNLSDVAAMGARPFAALLAASLPVDTTEVWLQDFAAGLAGDCRDYGIALIGGDTVATPGPLTLTVTAFGLIPIGRELRRGGAKVGDRVYVSGTLGDAALGLKIIRRELDLPSAPAGELVDRYRLPRPRVELGGRLVGLAHAAMDVSDGLWSDLGHICDASGVGAVIEARRLPLSEAARSALDRHPALIAEVLTGGDDYEILFTAPAAVDEELAALAATLGLPLTAVGAIVAGRGVEVDGVSKDAVRATGYNHFRDRK